MPAGAGCFIAREIARPERWPISFQCRHASRPFPASRSGDQRDTVCSYHKSVFDRSPPGRHRGEVPRTHGSCARNRTHQVETNGRCSAATNRRRLDGRAVAGPLRQRPRLRRERHDGAAACTGMGRRSRFRCLQTEDRRPPAATDTDDATRRMDRALRHPDGRLVAAVGHHGGAHDGRAGRLRHRAPKRIPPRAGLFGETEVGWRQTDRRVGHPLSRCRRFRPTAGPSGPAPSLVSSGGSNTRVASPIAP